MQCPACLSDDVHFVYLSREIGREGAEVYKCDACGYENDASEFGEVDDY